MGMGMGSSTRLVHAHIYIVTSSLKFVTLVGIASWKYTLLASTYQPGGGGED